MSTQLEHANLQVFNIDDIAAFLMTALPDFRIRHEGGGDEADRWLHIGTDHCYLALSQVTELPAEQWVPYSGRPGVNHLGFEVDDADALRNRLLAAGYRETTYPNNHPHRKRVYFADPEGNDWEFVQYFSEIAAERNDYSDAG